MRTPAEKPRGGGAWMGNALVFERQRRLVADEALSAEERGNENLAAELRTYEDGWRRDRDRAQRLENSATMNRALCAHKRWTL